MKNINHLKKLEELMMEDDFLSVSSEMAKRNGKNEFNELSNLSLFPDEIMPNIPDPKKIDDFTSLEKYKIALSEWLEKFKGQSRISDEFNRGMDLQRRLTVRARELTELKIK